MKDGIRRKVRCGIPNALTLCNSLCGFAAILYMLRAYEYRDNTFDIFAVSAMMIFSAMVFDALDGFVARLLHASSMEGIQMDSLSDMVTFGVAPATLVAIMTHSLRDWDLKRAQEILVYVLCAIYLGCAALRLAIYNVQAIDPSRRIASSGHFSGLPSPGAAAAICVVVLFARECRFDLYRLAFVLPIYAGVLGLLMVSHIQYLHAGKWLISMFHSPKKMMFFAVLLAIAIIGRAAGLALIVTGYILSGPLQAIFKKLRPRAAAASTEGPQE